MLAFEPTDDLADARLLQTSRRTRARTQGWLAVAVAGVFAWTSHAPAEPAGYWLAAAPVLAGAVLCCATRRQLPLSLLASGCIAALSVFLLWSGSLPAEGTVLTLAGGPALVVGPATLVLARAFLVGAVVAVLAREILLRKSPLLPGRWLAFLVVCVCLAAFQVLALVALAARGALAAAPPAVVLDGPWELLLVQAGAASALLALRRLHDRQISLLWAEFTPDLNWRLAGLG